MGAVCSVSSSQYVTLLLGKNLESRKAKRQEKNGTLLKMASSLSTGIPKCDNAEQQYIYIYVQLSLPTVI